MIEKFISLISKMKYNAKGTLILTQGCPSQIKVKTQFTPKKVWVEMSEVCGIPVCHAQPDCFDVRIVPGGFILHIVLHSKERKIKWIAKK